MRLPPRQSTAEADLTVPFQLVCLTYDMNIFWLHAIQHVQILRFTKLNCYFFEMQAALKTIGEEDKYFSKVSLRLGSIFVIFPSFFSSFMLSCYKHRVLISSLPPLGCLLLESQLNLP